MTSATSPECCEAFSRSAEIYDLVHSGKDYDGEAKRVLELLGPFGKHPPQQTLIDWGAGTGEFTQRFSDAGWRAIGVELLHEMCIQALRKNIDVRQGDMCNLSSFCDHFSAQTCLFAAFSYASAFHPPLLILENFRKAAAPGGRLVFDFVNADAEMRGNQVRDVMASGGTIRVAQSKRLVDMRLIENKVTYQHAKISSGTTDIWQELHYLRTFTRREIAELIARAGWSLQKFTNIEDSHREFNGGPEPYYLTAVCSLPSPQATPRAA